MKRYVSGLVTALVIALFGIAVAQEQEQAPLQEPAEARDVALLRLVNAAPTGENVTVELRSNDNEAGAIGETFADLSYMDVGEYVEMPARTYEVHVSHNDEYVFEDTINLSSHRAHTLVVMGLYVPEEQLEEAEDEGFFAWLRDLFTGDDPADRDELALRAYLIDDELEVDLQPGETRIRAVHAAPGTAPVDIAVEGERGSIIGNLGFGESSRYHDVEETVGNLVVRISGSRAKVLDLGEVGLESGMVNTVIVTGTPVEELPIEALVLSDAPRAPGEPLADPGVVAPEDPAEEPAEVDDDQVVEEQVVEVVLDEWTVDLSGDVQAGPVTFNIFNEGSMPHSFAIEGEGVQEGLAMELAAGESVSVSLDLQAGSYRVYCPIGDHAEQGMETQLEVAAAE